MHGRRCNSSLGSGSFRASVAIIAAGDDCRRSNRGSRWCINDGGWSICMFADVVAVMQQQQL